MICSTYYYYAGLTQMYFVLELYEVSPWSYPWLEGLVLEV